MKVSHEFPIDYLKEGQQYIDYEFCLPHLLDQSDKYKEYFLEAKQKGRYIIMDNSLHELGEPYYADRLYYWLNRLEPNEFIVPDYWEDVNATLVKAKEWIYRKIPTSITLMAVVQANNKSDAIRCYDILKTQGYKKIAFSYGANWYYQEGLSTTPDENNKFLTKGYGRYNFIKELYDKGLIVDNDKIHLLGCNLPQEFSLFKGLPFIDTIDTSNPVIHGLAGIKYEDYGLLDKVLHKVDRYVGDEDNWDIVVYNINKFKTFIK